MNILVIGKGTGFRLRQRLRRPRLRGAASNDRAIPQLLIMFVFLVIRLS